MRLRFAPALSLSAVIAVIPIARAAQQIGVAPFVAKAYESTYQPFPSRPTVIRNATILTAAGPILERGSILLQGGKVAAIGQIVTAPAGALVIDATGKWVTPGIIDTHSHMGVYAAPGIESLEDGNEVTSPNGCPGLASPWCCRRTTHTTRETSARKPATRLPTASIGTPRFAPSRSSRRACGVSRIGSVPSNQERTRTSSCGPPIHSS